jgi:hypothetical protein
MSKSKKTTKVATLHAYLADTVDGYVDCGNSLMDASITGVGHVMVSTSCGVAQWVNTFCSGDVGDKVILRRTRKGAPWVMTGFA